MRKIFKLFTFIMVLISAFSIIACTEQEVTIESISIDNNSIPTLVLIDELNTIIEDIKVKVTKSNGETEEVTLTKTMISDADWQLLQTVGNHTITINYESVSCTVTLNMGLVDERYTVKVVYPDNTPVSNIYVQWCAGNNCFIPVKTNNSGYSRIALEDGEYYIHLESGIPNGYTYDPNAYTTTKNSKFIEIKLIKSSTITLGEGTQSAPYVVSNSAYNVSFTESGVNGMQFFAFTPSESGNYSIVSLAIDKLAINAIDPYIGFLGTETDMSKIDVSGNQASSININFNHTFEAEAGVTYVFTIFVSSATKFPATFDFVIYKN